MPLSLPMNATNAWGERGVRFAPQVARGSLEVVSPLSLHAFPTRGERERGK